MIAEVPAAPTVGEICRRCNQPVHRVEYIIESRGLVPVMRAGNVRIFSEEDAEFIASELAEIDSRQGRTDA